MDKGSGSGIFPDPDPGDRKKHRIRIRNTEQNTTVGMCVVLWNLLCHNTFLLFGSNPTKSGIEQNN